MSALAEQKTEAPMSYAAIFAAVAAEIANTRELVALVESAVCKIAEAAPMDSDVVADLQQLDRALQQLAALHGFAQEISADADRSAGLAIGPYLQAIPIHDLRSRIAGEMAEISQHSGVWEEF